MDPEQDKPYLLTFEKIKIFKVSRYSILFCESETDLQNKSWNFDINKDKRLKFHQNSSGNVNHTVWASWVGFILLKK